MSSTGRAAGIQVEKVRLHPLGNVPSNFGKSDSIEPARHKSRVSSVSFRRTTTTSDGTPEIEAGEALLKVMHVLHLDGLSRTTGVPNGEQSFQAQGEDASETSAADNLRTGPSQLGDIVGQEIEFVGMNKAIENRVCINLRRMSWEEPPRTMFLVEKSDGWRTGSEGRRLSQQAVLVLERICRYCKETLGLNVVVEGRIKRELPQLTFLIPLEDDDCVPHYKDDSNSEQQQQRQREERPSDARQQLKLEALQAAAAGSRARMQHKLASVDFIVAIGTDGCVVDASSFFDGPVPPMLAFASSFAYRDDSTAEGNQVGLICRMPHTEALDELNRLVTSKEGMHLCLRVRLRCVHYDAATRQERVFFALNDVVLDRGPSPFLTAIEVYCNNRKVTLVQGDGLILATPTGSTAYSMAAGGSMVHPDVPCLLLTPLNPHSLSFRPLILPADVSLKLQLTASARAPAWVAFDGRNRRPLNPGDRLSVSIAQFPVPVFVKGSATADWLDGSNAFMSRMVSDYVARFRLRPLL